jgi:hypothetical protein
MVAADLLDHVSEPRNLIGGQYSQPKANQHDPVIRCHDASFFGVTVAHPLS